MYEFLNNQVSQDDDRFDRALRPQSFDDYIGQTELIDKLRIAIQAAQERNQPLDHCLWAGGPGRGKSSLAGVVAKEYGCEIKTLMCPTIKSVADLLNEITKIEKNSILFLEECHALDNKVCEVLYTCLEDFVAHIRLPNKQSIAVDLNPFCCIGATTKPGSMNAPFRDRFSIIHTLRLYTEEELTTIGLANANKLELHVQSEEAIKEVARRSRGTPRILNRYLRRIRDYCQVKYNNTVSIDAVNEAFELEGIDQYGLSETDKKYLVTLFKVYGGGPCGIKPVATSIQEEEITVKDSIEPYLIQKEMIALTQRGRVLTQNGIDYVLENINKG